jgi:hypothetical protein
MKDIGHLWAIVLAAGEGNRLMPVLASRDSDHDDWGEPHLA